MKQNATVKETVDAKANLGRREALQLAARASTLIVAKGNKVARFSMKKDRPDDDTILSHMLGPTGNLRAPTLRIGRTVLVGFHEDALREALGADGAR